MERMMTQLDDVEAASVRRLASEDDRSVAAMLRRLVCESLDRRSAGGDGGWTASARRAPEHRFTGQPGNALRCSTCGGKAGDHRE